MKVCRKDGRAANLLHNVLPKSPCQAVSIESTSDPFVNEQTGCLCRLKNGGRLHTAMNVVRMPRSLEITGSDTSQNVMAMFTVADACGT
jgi:hypothetical protein